MIEKVTNRVQGDVLRRRLTGLVLVMLGSMMFVSYAQLIIYPVHNPLPVSSPSPQYCNPDQVYITDNYQQYNSSTTRYQGQCIKCTQFSPMLQKCQIYYVRRQVIAVQITQLFSDFSGQKFSCLTSNGYILQNKLICVDMAIEKVPNTSQYQNRQCFPHVPQCYSCWNFTSGCQRCSYGYYPAYNITISKIECLLFNSTLVNPYCWMSKVSSGLNSLQNCQACRPTYFLACPNSSGNNCNCTKCPTNCSQCYQQNSNSQIICTKCLFGYQHPDTNCTTPPLSICSLARSTCSQCINRIAPSGKIFEQCISCPNNSTYLNRQATKCISNCSVVQPYCKECYNSVIDNKTKCRKCKDGFYVSWFGGCQSCQASLQYCGVCTDSHTCTQCVNQMAYLNQSQCILCSVSIANCRLCNYKVNSPLICTKCKQGYCQINANNNFICVKCSNPRCKTYYDNNTCETCKSSPKYYLNLINLSCQNCSQVIPNCGQCQPNSKYAQCIYCENNTALYPLAGGQKICGPCSYIDTNCVKCKKGNMCTGCNLTSGTYLSMKQNKCVPCQPPCLTCSNRTQCQSCSSNYLVISNTTFKRCEACWIFIPNCEQCQLNGVQYQCTLCKPQYLLQYNTHVDLQCTPCSPGQYPNNTISPQCVDCSNKCLTCYNATTCKSCIAAYYAQLIAQNVVNCIDLCGDESIIDYPCDLWRGNVSDGCTSQCQVQDGFICDLHYSINRTLFPNPDNKTALLDYINSIPRTSSQYIYSICSYNGSVKMSIKSIIKQQFENTLTIEITLMPFLFAYTLLTPNEINQLISASYQSTMLPQSSVTTTILSKNQSFIITILQQQSFLLPLTLYLSHRTITTDKQKFKHTKDSFIQVETRDQRSLSAFYYEDGELKLWSGVYVCIQVVAVVVVVCAAASLRFKNLAGIQLLWVLQSMYASLFWYEQPLSLPLYSLSGLSLSNGYNPQSQITRPFNPQTLNSTRLLYTYNANSGHFNSSFVSIPYMVSLFVLLYYLSYLGWVCKDAKNPRVKKWSKFFQQFLYNDGLLIVTMFQLLPLMHQAFLLKQNWSIIGNWSQFLGTIFITFGLCCSLMIIIKWFRANHLGYQKIQQGSIVPYMTFFSPFNRHNFPILKQKFYLLYIITMVLATVACVFGGFYPLIPCLLYVMLAFLIEFYQPYCKPFSNRRATYYSLVIAYGYLLRVIYLFSYQEDLLSLNGIIQHNLWTIWLWMIALLLAIVVFFVDVITTYRQNERQKKRICDEFQERLRIKDKQFQLKLLKQQAKRHQSIKGNMQYVMFDFNYTKSSIVNEKKQQNKQLNSSNNTSLKATCVKKKNQSVNPNYSSINNTRTKLKKRSQSDYSQNVHIDQQTLGNKQWLLSKKQAITQQRYAKQAQKISHFLKLSYKLVNLIFEQKQEINKAKYMPQLSLKERLIQINVMEQYERYYYNPDEQEKPQIQLTDFQKQKHIKKQQLDRYKIQMAYQKHQPKYSLQGNFPKVEIHYQKASIIEQNSAKNKQHSLQKQHKKQQHSKQLQKQPQFQYSLEKMQSKMKNVKDKLKMLTINNEQKSIKQIKNKKMKK